jgi:hypothetical protein
MRGGRRPGQNPAPAASGPMPPALAAKFTQAEMAAFRIVSDEVRHHGVCALHIPAHAAPRSSMPSERLAASTWPRSRSAAVAGSARSPTLSTSFRGSGGIGSPMGVGSENRPPRTSVQDRRRKTGALAVAGNGITDTTTTNERDTDAP